MTVKKAVSLVTIPEVFEAFIREQLKVVFGIKDAEIKVERPPNEMLGDFAAPLHSLARVLKRAPKLIAQEFIEKSKEEVPPWIQSYFDTNGYVNMTVAPAFIAEQIFGDLEAFMTVSHLRPETAGQKIMVESPSPNTNKPFHLGHIRNGLLGSAIVRLLRFLGFDVIAANLLNDRGIHICKSMIAYERQYNGQTPESIGLKGDHFIGKCYVLFETWIKLELKELFKKKYGADPDVEFDDVKDELLRESKLQQEALVMLKKWEEEDPDVRKLWKELDGWVVSGFEETLARLGISHDKVYRESDTYTLGRKIIEQGLAKGLFKRREDGAVIIDLSSHGFDPKVLLRPDGTTVYMTQDIGTAELKEEDFGLRRSIYVVANEQDHHFKVLFKILELLGYSWAGGLYHLSYGMVELPEGRMKSREGTVVDADDLMEEVVALAREVTGVKFAERKQDISEEELDVIAEKLGIGALKFHFLLARPESRIKFNPAKAVTFEGKTGPFVSYVFARIHSMLTKGSFDSSASIDTGVLAQPVERSLLMNLAGFQTVVLRAADELDPSLIVDYVFKLAQAFNSFYNTRECKVLSADTEELKNARLMLSFVTARVIEKCMDLLGIQVPKRM
ncbi:arginine--tRNA ligase [Patescibacteria group bacterium]|nr:arginine--tRNA ligase [Patescibacteria group bacterium]